MAMYYGVNGEKRKVARLFCGVNGGKRELKALYMGVDGQKKKIFSMPPKTTLLAHTPLEPSLEKTEGSYLLIPGKLYELYVIDSGGDGGHGGSGWGLYRGGGGGAGGTGGIAYVKFIVFSENCKITWTIQNYSQNNVNARTYVYVDDANDDHLIRLNTDKPYKGAGSPNDEWRLQWGQDGNDAGAFTPNPSGGINGLRGFSSLYVYPNITSTIEILDSWELDGSGNTYDTQTAAGNRYGTTAPAPPETPFTTPPYLAQAGQNAYYCLDPEIGICLGNAGGGGNEGSPGGKGAPGGVVLVESYSRPRIYGVEWDWTSSGPNKGYSDG